MTQSDFLPSALKVAAEVDAALAQAGLAGPQVEREAIPMYLSMLHELMDGPEAHVQLSALNKLNVAEYLANWMVVKQLPVDQVINTITDHVNEVIELSRVHGTLQDFKRRELLSLHRNIVEALKLPSTLLTKPHANSL